MLFEEGKPPRERVPFCFLNFLSSLFFSFFLLFSVLSFSFLLFIFFPFFFFSFSEGFCDEGKVPAMERVPFCTSRVGVLVAEDRSDTSEPVDVWM
jgi:hypothetical protein